MGRRSEFGWQKPLFLSRRLGSLTPLGRAWPIFVIMRQLEPGFYAQPALEPNVCSDGAIRDSNLTHETSLKWPAQSQTQWEGAVQPLPYIPPESLGLSKPSKGLLLGS